MWLAGMLLVYHKNAEAAEQFELLQARGCRSPRVLLGLAQCHILRGERAEAAADGRALPRGGPAVPAHRERGRGAALAVPRPEATPGPPADAPGAGGLLPAGPP